MTAKRLTWLCVVPILAVGLLGCPERRPPFDATGAYEGTWSTTGSKALVVEDCPLWATLYQEPDIPLINFTVAGSLTLDWSCLLPPGVIELLGIEMPEFTVPVLAQMEESGAFQLNVAFDFAGIPSQLLDLIEPGALDDFPLQAFDLTLDAQGHDDDDDGMMDRFAGNLSVYATYEAEGTQTIDAAGTFQAERLPDTT